MDAASSRFETEVTHFYLISLLNIVFAALAIAFGVSSIVSFILGQTPDVGISFPRIGSGILAMICFGLGLSWLLSTIRIFEGIETIQDTLRRKDGVITGEQRTCMIVRMLAHYRDNRETIRIMILVCALGGAYFFSLGIANSLKVLAVSSGGFSFTLDNLLLIPAMLLTLGISLASLLSSYYFAGFAQVWERRLLEIKTSECALKENLGLDDQ